MRWLFFVSVVMFLLVSTVSVSALSNESLEAKELLDRAKLDIEGMELESIPISRVSEKYSEGLQIYLGQLSLERSRKKFDYGLAIEYAKDVEEIKKQALLAKDELQIFNENYNAVSLEVDLSSMDSEYRAIVDSYNEERFEDTIVLIDEGYLKLSEVQSNQTAIKLVYRSTIGVVWSFIVKQWVSLLVLFLIGVVLLIYFWEKIKRTRLRVNLNHLDLQKATVRNLMKKMQHDYFKKKDLPEVEFRIKSQTFEELVRDIDRKILIVKEEVFRLNKRKKRERVEKGKGVGGKKVKGKWRGVKGKFLGKSVRGGGKVKWKGWKKKSGRNKTRVKNTPQLAAK